MTATKKLMLTIRFSMARSKNDQSQHVVRVNSLGLSGLSEECQGYAEELASTLEDNFASWVSGKLTNASPAAKADMYIFDCGNRIEIDVRQKGNRDLVGQDLTTAYQAALIAKEKFKMYFQEFPPYWMEDTAAIEAAHRMAAAPVAKALI